MKEFVISEAQVETAILVGLITQTQDERKTKEYLDELEFLAETAGATVVKRFTQKLPAANSVTYVGKGKLEEIKEYIHQEEENEREVGMVIFDDELSAKQIRNIEAELKVKILDRTSLILDIFAMRAQTANAKTQVELAQYKYMLPRLQRLWTHLERQGGGSGAGGGKGSVGLRGPGETQLEMDRRIILNRMSLLKERLAEIDKQKSTQRKNRGRMIRVALVGYTNVGKSTLMNLLSKSEVFAENKLFATLDTTVRKVIIENLPFLLTDTVGFIRKLPTDLVDSFKSTLDEVREADLLIHVVDISHPDFEEQISVVDKTIADLGAGGVSTGSKSVLTINLNRCIQHAVKSGILYPFFLEEVVDLVHKVQLAYNENLKLLQSKGMLPLFDAGYINMNRQYLTIGVNGLVEAAQFMGIEINDNPKYEAFVQEILGMIERYNRKYRTKDVLFNCEMIPAENVGVKHAKWDKEAGFQTFRECYNSYFYIVEDKSLNVVDKFRLHGRRYIKHLTGGSALHMNLEEHLSKEQYRQLLRVAAIEGCNYFTFNIPNTICNECKHIDKRYLHECPECHSRNVDYLTRVIGYMKRISNFSQARQKEAAQRYYAPLR